MLRMPEFELHLPKTAADAVRLRVALPSSLYVAGGTDLLPNLKHQLHEPAHLVGLSDVHELHGIALLGDGTLRIGAGSSLQTIADDPTIRREVPGLSMAAGLVAGPQHRRMGTIGGNVMLDTRCLFYNQSEMWRKSLGFCLKKDGAWCHVIGSKSTCVAAQSSDTVPVLIAVGASLDVLGPDGPIAVPLDEVFTQDGTFEGLHTLPGTALVRAIVIPPRAPGHRSTYRKVRSRAAVDFPQLGIGLSAAFDGDRVTALAAVVGALMPKPRVLKNMDQAVGNVLDDALIATLADEAFKQTRPQRSLHGDPAWRRHMARVEMRRGLEALRESA
jgi:4-hydroxybenzoyl-CoA reductase subunit beta